MLRLQAGNNPMFPVYSPRAPFNGRREKRCDVSITSNYLKREFIMQLFPLHEESHKAQTVLTKRVPPPPIFYQNHVERPFHLFCSFFCSDVWQVCGMMYARVRRSAWSWWKWARTRCGIAEQGPQPGRRKNWLVAGGFISSYQLAVEFHSKKSHKRKLLTARKCRTQFILTRKTTTIVFYGSKIHNLLINVAVNKKW